MRNKLLNHSVDMVVIWHVQRLQGGLQCPKRLP